MSDTSAIEWTDATWNPIVGCKIVSPGCTNCYAMKMAARIEAMGGAMHYAGTTKKVNGNAVWTGKLALAPDRILTKPLSWKQPRRVFVNSMGDLFHEDAPDEWIDRCFAVMALSPQHEFQVLTKRAERMRDYLSDDDRPMAIGVALGNMLDGVEHNEFPIPAPTHTSAPPSPQGRGSGADSGKNTTAGAAPAEIPPHVDSPGGGRDLPSQETDR